MPTSHLRSLRLLPLLLLVCLALTSCRIERPKGVLSPRKMEAVLYDYHLVQAMAADLRSDDRYQKELYLNYVYDKHAVTQAQLDSSLIWYTRNPKELNRLYDNLPRRTEEETRRIEARKAVLEHRANVPVEGDSADLWYECPLQLFSSHHTENRLTFTVPSDTNFRKNDRIEWESTAIFVGQGLANLSLVVRLYDGRVLSSDTTFATLPFMAAKDSTLAADSTITAGVVNARRLCLVIPTDTLSDINEVSGSVYFAGLTSTDRLVLGDLRLMRYHVPQDTLRRNSEQTIAVATATLSNSTEVSPAG